MSSRDKGTQSHDGNLGGGERTAEKPQINKAKLTVFVDHRGIKVDAMITLRNGQDIRLSIDEANELGNLLAGFY